MLGVGTHVDVGVGTHVGLRYGLTADLAVLAEVVASVSAVKLDLILDQMLVAGEVRIEDEPTLEDKPGQDEDASELEYGDEDVPGDAEEGVDTDETEGPFRDDVFEIRVKEGPAGTWWCDVPLSGWEGAVGVGRYGKRAVGTVSARCRPMPASRSFWRRTIRTSWRTAPFPFGSRFANRRSC